MRPATFFITFSILILATLSWRATAAQAVALVWSPSPSPHIAGYSVRYGLQSGKYTSKVHCGKNTAATVTNLMEGLTYYFVVTANTSSGAESAPSNEAGYTVPGIAPPGKPWVTHVGGTAVLKWNPSPSANASGYNVYFGTTKVSQTQLAFSGSATQMNLSQSGYYAVSAFDSSTWEQSPRPTPVQFTGGSAPVVHLKTPITPVQTSASGSPTTVNVAASTNGKSSGIQQPLNNTAHKLASGTNRASLLAANPFTLQLEFGTTSPLQADGLTFTLRGSSNVSGHIEFSTNLLTWMRWTNFGGAESAITFLDPGAVHSPCRYYRAVIP